MKTIKELLQVMLNHQQLFCNGLCTWALELYHYGIITKEEHKLLAEYISNNRPSMFSSLESFTGQTIGGGYYWTPTHIEPRIKWINKHIKKNS